MLGAAEHRSERIHRCVSEEAQVATTQTGRMGAEDPAAGRVWFVTSRARPDAERFGGRVARMLVATTQTGCKQKRSSGMLPLQRRCSAGQALAPVLPVCIHSADLFGYSTSTRAPTRTAITNGTTSNVPRLIWLKICQMTSRIA